MAHYASTLPSSWTPAQTFDYLADFRSSATWDPSVTSARLLGGEAGQVGARFEVVTSALGRTATLIYEVITAERPSLLVLRAETASLVVTDTITVDTDESGTSVSYDMHLELRGARKLADPLSSVTLTRAGDRASDGLRIVLSS